MNKLDIPSLDVLEEYLRRGFYIGFEDDDITLFEECGECFVYGDTLREMLANLIMADGCE